MGRKRNQGKARRAAKAKARREAAEEGRNTNADGQQQSLAVLMPVLIEQWPCTHGADILPENDVCWQFLTEFTREVSNAGGISVNSISNHLSGACDATWDKFAEVWKDSAKMETAMSFFLCMGTHDLLEGKYDNSRDYAAYARYFEQHITVVLTQTQALYNWPKIEETFNADMHTLVKFLRRRIPCSCLDEKYNEVKFIPKMGFCYNPECKYPGGMTDRSKTKYCSRCRCVTYCSRECQEANWTIHKPACDKLAVAKAEIEVKHLNV